MTPNSETAKPKRLYFKTYLQFIKNSIGSQAYRNFYIQNPDGSEQDAKSLAADRGNAHRW